MERSDVIFGLTVLFFAFAVIFVAVVIAVAVFFQKIRKKIESEFVNSTEQVRPKTTVQERKKQNKYYPSRKRKEDREPSFYESPAPTNEGQKELLQLKTFQRQQENPASRCEDHNISEQFGFYIDCIRDDEYDGGSVVPGRARDHVTRERNIKQPAKTLPRSSVSEGSYIECIGGDVHSQRKATFQNAIASSKPRHVTQQLSHNANRDGKPSCSVTLPMHTATPGKNRYKLGFKDSSCDTVTQQQASRNINRHIPSGKTSVTRAECSNPNAEEMYEIMGQTDEVRRPCYENTGFTNDTNEELYGNQEVIEEENKRRSQDHTGFFLPGHTTTRDAHKYLEGSRIKNTKHQDSYGEEIYQNQEVVDKERRKSVKHDVTYNRSHVSRGHVASGQTNLSMNTNSVKDSPGEEQLELYENYIEENMYENC